MMVPAAYGGTFEEIDPLAICLIREVMMSTSCHLDSLFALQGIGSYGITSAGSTEQREYWLPKVASADALAGLALTEEQAGSDLKASTTEIVSSAEGLRLNGSKAFISNAGSAAFYEVFAKEGDGYSLILVPADSKGISISAAPELIAPHVLGDLHFDNVLLPESARLGQPGKGLGLVRRSGSLARFGRARGITQAASHGSNDLTVAAKLLRIHNTVLHDYEGAAGMHRINFRLANKVMLPDIIPFETSEKRRVLRVARETGVLPTMSWTVSFSMR